jgi:hypothetical protein
MDDVNIKKTVKDVHILMCTTYLSVGVDILDKYKFSVYFEDLMMPQEVEQFANRLRSNDLFIHVYVAKNDSEGNTRSLHRFKNVNFELDDEEKRFVMSVIQLCNSMIERNRQEFKSNHIVYSMLADNQFIKHNPIDDMYHLDLTAYKTVCFERKYREYVEQLPVLMKGMSAYGYEVTAEDKPAISEEGKEDFSNLSDFVKLAYDEQLELNTKHIEELMENINENNLNTYRGVLNGQFDIKKGKTWGEDNCNGVVVVKNVEVFEKVVPIFVSLSKRYEVDQIRNIFEHCRNKNGTFNFAAIGRIRTLVNLIYNDKNNRLDLPIKEFMNDTYKFIERGSAKKTDIEDFCNRFAEDYARKESKGQLIINYSVMTMDVLKDKFLKLFKCLVEVGKPKKKDGGKCELHKVELLWKEREWYGNTDLNDKVFILSDLLDIGEVTIENN